MLVKPYILKRKYGIWFGIGTSISYVFTKTQIERRKEKVVKEKNNKQKITGRER